MPSRAHAQSRFQPPPPIRTSTGGSHKSQSTGATSPDMLSPTSTTRSAASPAEESFFGAITTRIRRARSRSRSRAAMSHSRSKSPMLLPPEQLPATSSTAQLMSPTSPAFASTRAHKSRHAPKPSQRAPAPAAQEKPARPSLQGTSRTSSDMWRGRHSNSWLFNDFSVTDTAKGFLRRKS